MDNTSYMIFPTITHWRNDTKGKSSKPREGDDILVRIDQLVEGLPNSDSNIQQLVRVDLFWCLDYWLKVYKSTPTMDESLEPAIHKLYVTVVNQLCANFNCRPNTLVNKLEEAFGRSVGPDGLRIDLGRGWVKYFSDTERKLYQLQFRGGLAYQRPWWQENADLSALVPVESSHASDPSAFFGTGAVRTNFAGFVMSMSRDFYMAKHGGPEEKNSRVYHSSYLGEDIVACAGTMLVQNGQIRVVCPDSGHFRPGDVNVMMMLRALQMHGVRLDQLIVQHFRGYVMGTANVIVRQQSWTSVLQHMHENLDALKSNQKLNREYKNPVPVQRQPSSNSRVPRFYADSSEMPIIQGPPQSVQNLYGVAIACNRAFYNG